MNPVIIVGIILVIGYFMSQQGASEVDAVKAHTPAPPSDAPATTVVTPQPDTSHVPPPKGPNDAIIELYTEKEYKGSKAIVRVGMTKEFARRQGKTVVFKYKSMKIVPGTMLMFTSESGGNTYRGFAVGKYDVPDMHEFFKMYDNLYMDDGLFMSPKWSHWPGMPFKVKVITEYDWGVESKKNYDKCINWIKKVAADKDEQYHLDTCEPRLPENNRNNITGFTSGGRYSGMSNGYAQTGPVFSRDMVPY